MRFAALAVLASTACRGCRGEEVNVESEVAGRPGLVAVETRTSAYDPGPREIVWRGVARNESERALIDLAISVEARRNDGSSAGATQLDVVGARGSQPLLVPGYVAPLEVKLPADAAPHRVVVTVSRAEAFSQPADTPIDLPGVGAEAARVRFQSLGHFRLIGEGDRLPFRMSLGIKNTGDEPLEALDFQIVLRDEEGRDADRLPARRAFVPPLAPGDAVIEELSRPVRDFAAIEVEARSVTTSKR